MQRVGDRLQNAFNVAQDFVVPKTQNAKMVLGQPSISQDITLVGRVLAAIDLNDDTLFSANKIDHVGSNGFLPNELESIE